MKLTGTGLFLAACLVSLGTWAQDRVEVYPNDRLIWSETLFHAENGLVREGN